MKVGLQFMLSIQYVSLALTKYGLYTNNILINCLMKYAEADVSLFVDFHG